MRLNGKIAVITGGSMGIGEAIAKAFVDEGASVVITSRDVARAEAARVRIGHTDRTMAVGCDVQRRADIEALLHATLQRFQRVDIWVNNAGHGLIDSVEQMNMAECRRMFDTNLFGAIEGMQVVTPAMKQQRAGTIINISSVAGHIAVPYIAAYCATKHALNAIGKAARVELKESGVHVMTVCPGYIATDFGLNAVKGAGAMRLSAKVRYGISVERVARAVVRGYVHQKREIVVPWQDRIIINLYRCLPSLVEWIMGRALRPAEQVVQQAPKK